jgi:enoyl-[acyl-carrier protein] reductase I
MASHVRAAGAREQPDLAGRKGLVVGIADADSLAWAAAQYLRHAGAELAITYPDERARPLVAPLARELAVPILTRCDVAVPAQLDAVFAAIRERWGRLDFLLHADGGVPRGDPQGRLVDCSAESFAAMMLGSCHALIRMARLAEPLMDRGGSVMTLSWHPAGKGKPGDHEGLAGPVEAALEATVRGLAQELGPKGIRVNAISVGPAKARKPRLEDAPRRSSADGREVARAALLLASDYATEVTGEVVWVGPSAPARTMVFH